jgi:hypothetical protein
VPLERQRVAPLLTCGLLLVVTTACTDSHPSPAHTVTNVETVTRSPGAIPTTPVIAGPTTVTTRDCPFVRIAVAVPIIGQRLDHSTVQTSGGRPVGCEFFPITTGPYASSEQLPKKGFPSARITVTTYPTARSARQVLALVSRAGRSPSQQSIAGRVGETFQTRFYPPDGTADWACAFIAGSKLVTVLVAEATSAGQKIVIELANASAARI